MRSVAEAARAIMTALCCVAAPVAASDTPDGDPPAEIGAPYQIDGVTFTPVDAPLDAVGTVELDGAVSAGVSAALRTLPLPSYAEVTALDSGRTILVRVERRGPMRGAALGGLSLAAFGQLGADPTAPLAVRFRRVSPQAYERALLRTGQPAPERLPTPKPLLEVLRKQLAAKERVIAPATSSAPKAYAAPPPVPDRGALVVQIGAFASKANAERMAVQAGAKSVAMGKLWLVRLGPFATRAEAQDAMAKARRDGFEDARILNPVR